MLVEFLGTPRSGKTSVAVRLFESVKSDGMATEFVPEQARIFIVEKRFKENIHYSKTPVLSDSDQKAICVRQMQHELMYLKTSSPETLIVADSSPLNALLYMTEETRQNPEVVAGVKSFLEKARPLVLVMAPIGNSYFGPDSNRVHTKEQADRIETEVLPKVIDLARTLLPDIHIETLSGSRQDRTQAGIWHSLDEMAKGIRR